MKTPITFLQSELLLSVRTLSSALSEVRTGLVCLTTFPDGIDTERLILAMERSDVLHCGLLFNKGLPFNSVQLCAFNWHFIDPDPMVRAVSWKPSLDFVVFDIHLFKELGGLDEGYEHPISALCDFAYRVLAQGGVVINDPQFGPIGHFAPRLSVESSGNDVARFVHKFIGKEALRYFRIANLMLSGKWARLSTSATFVNERLNSSKLFVPTARHGIGTYTAVIPTINRYDYIIRSISSLLALRLPPSEIIVVDQSPKECRNTDIYSSYVRDGLVKVIYLDVPGQSTARNVGIRAATSSWILLFEDDAEAWPEMVDEHIKLLESTQADVSTGVVVVPGADESFIPASNRFYFLSDILTTGNAFLSKSAAQSIGGFDKAFDRGPGADDDFGKRLYRSGKLIVYNFKSIETHFKAPRGGMREHGIWWRNTSSLLGPFPPVTQLYSIRKYYPRKYWLFLIITIVLKARKKYSPLNYIFLWILLPIKVVKSWKATMILEGKKRREF